MTGAGPGSDSGARAGPHARAAQHEATSTTVLRQLRCRRDICSTGAPLPEVSYSTRQPSSDPGHPLSGSAQRWRSRTTLGGDYRHSASDGWTRTECKDAPKDHSPEAPCAPACKPGSVRRASSPGRSFLSAHGRPYAPAAYPRRLCRDGHIPRRLFGLAPTGVYLPRAVAGRVVGSYPTLFTLAVPGVSRGPLAVLSLWHCPSRGLPRAQGLPGGLPIGARTFLERSACAPARDRPAGALQI